MSPAARPDLTWPGRATTKKANNTEIKSHAPSQECAAFYFGHVFAFLEGYGFF